MEVGRRKGSRASRTHPRAPREYLLRHASWYLGAAEAEGRLAGLAVFTRNRGDVRSWLRSLPLVVELERLIAVDDRNRQIFFAKVEGNTAEVTDWSKERWSETWKKMFKKDEDELLREETQVTELNLRKADVIAALEAAAAAAQTEYDAKVTRITTELTAKVAVLPLNSKERLLYVLANEESEIGGDLRLQEPVGPDLAPGKLVRVYSMADGDTVTVTDTDAAWRYL